MNPFSKKAKILRLFLRERNARAKEEGLPVCDWNTVKQEWEKLTPEQRADIWKAYEGRIA